MRCLRAGQRGGVCRKTVRECDEQLRYDYLLWLLRERQDLPEWHVRFHLRAQLHRQNVRQ